MKRLGLTLMAAVCLTATTFAAGNQPTTAKWDGNINVTKLSRYLLTSSLLLIQPYYQLNRHQL